LKKETDVFSVERRNKVKNDLALKKEEASILTREWQAGEYFISIVLRLTN
jgi:ATP-dependent Clp protease ATP-binding subunit ClpB